MEKGEMNAAAANNSSDFVRKLYKMLEDSSYNEVVRWGNEGDSFVVLENEKFTKLILPKHFKHSNFASFVRQLNKYDFHKVRQNNEDNGVNPYGPGAWEFKHPEFQANNKDSLDNIKRKAPAPRKAATSQDDSFPAQQIDMVNTQLVATQQQLMHLQASYQDLQQGHVILMGHVKELTNVLKRHDGAMRGVLRHLGTMDQQKRARSGAYGNGIGIQDLVGNGPDDHPASPLLQVSQLLGEFSNNDSLFTKDLDQMQNGLQYRNHSEYSTPSNSNDHSGVAQTPTSAVQDNMPYAQNYDLDNMVYPVGQINGIDPINSEHINNIPYSFPPSGSLATQGQGMGAGGGALGKALNQNGRPRKPPQESIWGPHAPRILLVEDDKTCARVGCKFLESFRCQVDIARNGLEAVEKMAVAGNGGSTNGPAGNGPGYDLILMDIIMPQLDGISATVCIRGGGWTGPVVAMTSNIRADDIEMYFKYGMNDVLPKPFTKEGMLRSLEKHLQQFKRGYAGPPPVHHAHAQMQQQAQAQQQQAQAQQFYAQSQSGGGGQPQLMNAPGPGQGSMSQASMQQSMVQTTMGPGGPSLLSNAASMTNPNNQGGMRAIKDEQSPLSKTSPANSWHSPQAMQTQSPNSTAPSLGISGGHSHSGSSVGGAGIAQGQMGQGLPQSGAAYSMTPTHPVPVYQQGAQAAVMQGQPGMGGGAMMRELREMPGMGREMAQVVAQQQQAEVQRQRMEVGRREEGGRMGGEGLGMRGGEGQGQGQGGRHRRLMGEFEGEQQQEAKRQRLYVPGPPQGGGPQGYS